ncbi:MAG: flavodoxin family protein [Syntrophales bacterium LBB04]|nr:flavodoxin family protein [Syntrophales bacterium LBB04]
MIKIIGICGSQVKDGNVSALLEYSLSPIKNLKDISCEVIHLAGKKIGPCLHCNWCINKQTSEKICAQEDDMALIYPKLLEADAILIASPAHFGRLSGLTADWMDRTRAFVHGKFYKLPLKNKIGGAMAVAFFRGAGVETTLSSIDIFFLTHQMILANSRLYQLGAGAYSSREGKGRFEKEIRHMTLEDEVGVLSARMLMERVIDLARIIRAGTKALGEVSVSGD